MLNVGFVLPSLRSRSFLHNWQLFPKEKKLAGVTRDYFVYRVIFVIVDSSALIIYIAVSYRFVAH